MISVECIGTLPAGVTRGSMRALAALAYRRAERRGAATVSIRVTDDRTIRALNRKHRGKNAVTDVLSFAYGTGMPAAVLAKGERELGDIVISLPQVRRQAKAIGRTTKAEFCLMVVHGMLHLLGYDHETVRDEGVMFSLQHDILIRAGIL